MSAMIRKHTILPILALAVLFLAPSCQKDRGYSIADDGSLMLQVMLPVEQFTKASTTSVLLRRPASSGTD